MFTEKEKNILRVAICECSRSWLHNGHVIDYRFFMVRENSTWWHFPLKNTRQIINTENIC